MIGVNVKHRKFSRALNKHNKKFTTRLNMLLRAIMTKLYTAIVSDTPVDTGKTRGMWTHPEVTRSITGVHTWRTGNKSPAIEALEAGASQQAPAGFVRQNIKKVMTWAKGAI